MGHNNYGQLGDNTTSDRYLPAQMLVLNNAASITAGFEYSMALTSSGAVFSGGSIVTGNWVRGPMLTSTSRYGVAWVR